MSQFDRDRKSYWRSLNEIRNTPEFEQYLHREFPVAASEFPEGVSRRRWMQLMGASFALGAAGCRYEEQTFAEFARRPQNRVPGETRQFATAIEFAGVGVPVLATSYDGRPIKLDGHPGHPDVAGGSTPILQATVLDLYDPDRSRAPLRQGEAAEWSAFDAFWSKQIADRSSGKGLAVLSQRTSSPSLVSALQRLRAAFPELAWYEYDAVSRSGVDAAVAAAWGGAYRLHLDMAAARVIVSIDADPLGRDIDGIRNARGWAQGREVESGQINRVYAIESQMSTTGMVADHRLPIRSAAIPGFVAALSAAVEARLADPAREVSGEGRERWLDALAQDLVAQAGQAAIVVGPRQSVEVQAAVHRLNAALGNVGSGKPIRLVEVPDSSSLGPGTIADLGAAIDAGAVDTLVVVGGNPVYDAPADVRFKERYAKVEERVHLALYVDETSAASTWHLNVAHPLESWSDSRAWDGSWCVGQPLIDPLWGGRSPLEFLDALATGVVKAGGDLVRATAAAADTALAADAAWKQLVHEGFAAGTAATPVEATVVAGAVLPADGAWASADSGLELVLSPAVHLYDGRYANNGWLQECPDPVTKVVWGNAALMAPSTAEELGVEQNTLVELSVGEAKVEVPAHLVPGQARGSIGLALGYGRTRVGAVGGSTEQGIETVGVDAYLFHRTGSTGVLDGLKVRPTGRPFELACTQDHYAIDELGLRTINERVGSLIRQGEWSDYELFMHDRKAWDEKHGGHGESHSAGESHDEKSASAVGEGEAHPESSDHPHEGHEPHSESHDDHAHSVQWPHSHHHFGTFNLNDGPGYDPEQPRWGMSIDLNKCTGCHACVVACQSENNVPVVGKDQVIRGRLMHWLRVDRYYVGDDYDDPQTVMQPVTCHHCENAPCEQVCPVAATVHSDEGLNDMVYNRCIGTRYCGNNCPYKVRRFNYLNYSEAVTFLKYPWADKLDQANRALRNLVMNPEVTIRSRGVMEKCTYCVQRIQNGKIAAKREGRSLGDNEITTACQDACPTQAIAFGDLNRATSQVAKGHANPRAYELLGELNVKARTRYLARVRNPHPALSVQSVGEAH